MRVGVYEKFTIIATAVRQGDRFAGTYRLRVDTDAVTTVDFLDEVFLNETFVHRQDAVDAAFTAGIAEAKSQTRAPEHSQGNQSQDE